MMRVNSCIGVNEPQGETDSAAGWRELDDLHIPSRLKMLNTHRCNDTRWRDRC